MNRESSVALNDSKSNESSSSHATSAAVEGGVLLEMILTGCQTVVFPLTINVQSSLNALDCPLFENGLHARLVNNIESEIQNKGGMVMMTSPHTQIVIEFIHDIHTLCK